MIRIRGLVGSWPVDLEIELDGADWARLAEHLPAFAERVNTAAEDQAKPPQAGDSSYEAAQALLRKAGALSGPQLLGELEPLAGNVAAAKRLLVRLRHCPQVRIEQQADAAVYRWIGE